MGVCHLEENERWAIELKSCMKLLRLSTLATYENKLKVIPHGHHDSLAHTRGTHSSSRRTSTGEKPAGPRCQRPRSCIAIPAGEEDTTKLQERR